MEQLVNMMIRFPHHDYFKGYIKDALPERQKTKINFRSWTGFKKTLLHQFPNAYAGFVKENDKLTRLFVP